MPRSDKHRLPYARVYSSSCIADSVLIICTYMNMSVRAFEMTPRESKTWNKHAQTSGCCPKRTSAQQSNCLLCRLSSVRMLQYGNNFTACTLQRIHYASSFLRSDECAVCILCFCCCCCWCSSGATCIIIQMKIADSPVLASSATRTPCQGGSSSKLQRAITMTVATDRNGY